MRNSTIVFGLTALLGVSATPFQSLCNIKCSVSIPQEQQNNISYLCRADVKAGIQRCVHQLCDCSISPAADRDYDRVCGLAQTTSTYGCWTAPTTGVTSTATATRTTSTKPACSGK